MGGFGWANGFEWANGFRLTLPPLVFYLSDASSLSSLSFHFSFSLQFLSTSFCSLLFKPETYTISVLLSSLSQISLFPSKKNLRLVLLWIPMGLLWIPSSRFLLSHISLSHSRLALELGLVCGHSMEIDGSMYR